MMGDKAQDRTRTQVPITENVNISARFIIEDLARRKAFFLGDYSAFPITHNLSNQLALLGQDIRTRTRAQPAYRLE